ncbi:MAG: AAA family ATPase [Micropruina sp.]|uniref:AAA family ATPase n=1 Tax=Micropruina sp. TaxID=2737536 RepID=UPI0039E6146E
MSTPDLATTLDALADAARAAGLDADAARTEGEQLAATVAESAVGSFVDWCTATGRPISAQVFMDAAIRGRRFRTSATPLVAQLHSARSAQAVRYAKALAEVASAAALLGTPTPLSVGAAQGTASAQLNAAQGLGGPVPPPSTAPGADAEFVRQAPQILSSVLERMHTSQSRLLDLQQLDPFGAGAFPGLGNTAAPTSPPEQSSGAQPVQAAPPPAEPAPEPEPEPPAEPEKSLDELLAELDALVGLTTVKAEIHRQTAVLKVDALRAKAGLKSPTITRHLVFVGNPGTGKTTVARLVAGIYRAVGLLSKGQLVEVDRSELVAGYLGQTAMKTAEVVAKAEGGVLFIDEAYSLNGDQYGEEAINTLVKEMEDKRNDLVVIVAGYPLPMQVFIAQNPGLASRFRTTIGFDDYSDAELEQIFTGMVAQADYDLGDGCLDTFHELLAGQPRDETFGNGRFARNVLEAAVGKHAWRLRDVTDPSLDQLRTLLPEDLRPDAAPAVDWPAAQPGGLQPPSDPTGETA